MIKLRKSEVRILNEYVKTPFASAPEIAKRLRITDSRVNTMFYDIESRNDLGLRGSINCKLFIMQKLGWIKSKDWKTHAAYERMRYSQIESLNYLQLNPIADHPEIMREFSINRGASAMRFYKMYRAFGVTGQQFPRLRMYYKLGWYRPFKLEV